ncbi:MAG: NUDIX domain-containing protein [Thermoplasmata archaeon]|nr:NUDIX domain-containing protein [Thermoplasmata archaeon]
MATEGPIHVVTCFLRRVTLVLLLKRSLSVKTNKGKWAGVSGYVEVGETPLETAYKELEEEVAARPGLVRLVREAKPLTFLDTEHDTTWVVHPFLFDDLGVEVVLDWEHTEFRWIEPEELGSFDTVVSLRRTLEAALDSELA